MKIEVSEAGVGEKPVIEQLLELYFYDIAEYANAGWRDIGPRGRYGYEQLDSYWNDPSRTPFLVRVDGQLAGLVLVNEHVVLDQPPHTKSIAEFFISRKYRGARVGRQVAAEVFKRFPGPWEVAQDFPNEPAQKFWRSVINDYTAGDFESTVVDDDRWHGPVLSFSKPQSGLGRGR